jgi:hypothetical protein
VWQHTRQLCTYESSRSVGSVLLQLQSAVHAYSSSLEAKTDDARVWANRSAAHLSAGNAAAALEDARIARRVDPTYAKVHQILML